MNAGIYTAVWLLVVGIWLSVFGCRSFCLEDNTERSESNPGRSLGIKTKEGEAVWKTVPCRCMLIAFFICFGTVFQTALFCYSLYPETSSRVTSLRSVLASSQSYLQPTIPNQ